jgi:hypothetical protein
MRSRNKRLGTRGLGPAVLIAIAIASVVGSGCGSGDDMASDGGSPADAEQEPVDVFELLARRNDARGGARFFEDVTELLHNQPFSIADAAPAPLTTAVVQGSVTDVTEGQAFTTNDDDATVETSWDDPNVQWRTFHATVRTLSLISGDAPATFTFGLALGPDATTDQVARGLVGSGRELLLFLVSGSPVFEYEPDIYSDIEDGAMIAVVDASGAIDFPVLDDETAAATLGSVRTIEDMRRAAGQPDASPIIVDVSGRRVSGG